VVDDERDIRQSKEKVTAFGYAEMLFVQEKKARLPAATIPGKCHKEVQKERWVPAGSSRPTTVQQLGGYLHKKKKKIHPTLRYREGPEARPLPACRTLEKKKDRVTARRNRKTGGGV